jgi:precorrin-2 dehydrogenase / sirohydrochlorin ferrochelatase
MAYLPIFLSIENNRILIIGGGKVALQKLTMLKQFTDRIHVVSEKIVDPIKELAFSFIIKSYDINDIEAGDIVYACTNNRDINRQILAGAHQKNCLVNVVDDPTLCDFITPAIYKEEHMVVAVSSGGKDTPKAITWRNKIKEMFL